MADDWQVQVVKKESWEAEQSDEDVKDSWDMEDEPQVVPEKKPLPPPKPVIKAPVAPPPEELTKEERDIAVKVADLNNAMDLFGISGVDARQIVGAPAKTKTVSAPAPPKDVISLGAKDPLTLPEFESLAKKLAQHLGQKFGSSPHYPLFLETLMRHSFAEREAPEVRKAAAILTDIANTKSKKPATKKAAPVVTAHKKGNDVDLEDYGDVYDDDDY